MVGKGMDKEAMKNKVKNRKVAELMIEDDTPINKPIDTHVIIKKGRGNTSVKKGLKFTDTHTQKTMFFKNELLERLMTLADGERGAQTSLLNEALEIGLKRLEKKAEKRID